MLPACAGVIPYRPIGMKAKCDAPRMRGGDPEVAEAKKRLEACSPHARG